MTGKIFRSIILVSVITLILSCVTVIGVSQNEFLNKHFDDIKITADLLAAGVNRLGVRYLEGADIGYRVTLIASDGQVLYDSRAQDLTENHKNREEIAEALSNGFGKAVRRSSDFHKKTLYYAVRLEDGSVLRVADDDYSVWKLLRSMLLPLGFLIVVIGALLVIIAVRVTDNIISPINSINLSNPKLDVKYSELSPLTEKIRRQNDFISTKMAELVENQKEFSLVTDSMSEGFIVFNNKGELLSYNLAAKKMLGIDMGVGSQAKTALGRSSELVASVGSALSGNRDEQHFMVGQSYYSVIANPVYRDGEITGAVAVILDVTEKEKMDMMRREFTSNVSHELKTPLTSIKGAAELIKSGMVRQEDLPSFGGMIFDESSRLVTLIDDILRLSQFDEEKIMLEKCDCDLYDIAEEVIKRLEDTAAERNVAVTLKGEHKTVFGVPTMLDEMIYNLCENAVKYNNENGSVLITVMGQSDGVRFSVADTGIGIAQEQLSRVFERFYRADKSRSKSIGGTGLGLSIVKHAAAFHNAVVDISSTENVGTTVTVLFKNEEKEQE